jgi:cysteine desulfurase/selenocysteine lyase
MNPKPTEQSNDHNQSLSEIEIKRIRDDFPQLAVKIHDKPLIYFDNAATSLKPNAVIDAVDDHYRFKTSNVHRGIHFLSEQATVAYENARTKIKNFINASHREEIVFTKGTTESINIVAQTYGRKFLEKGDEILISEMEHHSNIVPWQMLCEEKGCELKVIPVSDSGDVLFEEFEKLLSEKTKLLALVSVSNTLGSINPVKEMIKKAHDYNVPVLIDAAQSVAHTPTDVQDLDCDFMVFSGHKMLSPTGIGVLYGKKELLEKMPPMLGGGSMIDEVTFAKTTYNTIPFKFEAGTPHVAGVIGFAAAIDYLNKIGMQKIYNYEKELLDSIEPKLKSLEGLRLIGEAKNKASISSFVLDGCHPHDIGTLIDMEGIAVRTGHHCTQPLLKRFGVPATIRASFSFYNTKEELETFLRALNKVKGML